MNSEPIIIILTAETPQELEQRIKAEYLKFLENGDLEYTLSVHIQVSRSPMARDLWYAHITGSKRSLVPFA